MNKLLHSCCLVAALLLAVPAQAAGDAPRQYDIELLVFQNLVQNDDGEVWPADYSNWYDDTAQPAATQPQPVDWLPDSLSHLKAERAALDRSSRYRTLAYIAWRQPVYDRNSAVPVDLPARGRSDGAWVDGSARVAVERYLHLSLDLQLHLPAGATSAEASPASGVAEQAPVAEIRLNESRRMRSRELHYFDNPRFGVIALITPYEPPSAPPAGAEPASPGSP